MVKQKNIVSPVYHDTCVHTCVYNHIQTLTLQIAKYLKKNKNKYTFGDFI